MTAGEPSGCNQYEHSTAAEAAPSAGALLQPSQIIAEVSHTTAYMASPAVLTGLQSVSASQLGYICSFPKSQLCFSVGRQFRKPTAKGGERVWSELAGSEAEVRTYEVHRRSQEFAKLQLVNEVTDCFM